MDKMPMVPLSRDDLDVLTATLMVYQRYRREKTASTSEREHTLFVLALLLPKLVRAVEQADQQILLPFTVEEARVMKGGLMTVLDQLKRARPAPRLKDEITRIQGLKTVLDQHVSTTQD